jgi:hypothetical protein
MNALNYYVTCSHIQVLIGQQAYLTRQIVLFDMNLFLTRKDPNSVPCKYWLRME